MPNYKKSIIYKIVFNNDNKNIFIGFTTNIKKIKSYHLYKSTLIKYCNCNGSYLHQYMFDLNYKNNLFFDIIILKIIECNNRKELEIKCNEYKLLFNPSLNKTKFDLKNSLFQNRKKYRKLTRHF